MAITIYDIAREAKVGIGTVSRVFNGHPNVTKETREKVLVVAKRLNYQPHVYAQGLARQRTNTFAAIIPFFTNYFFIEVLQGVQEKISSIGFDLILHGINHPDEIDESLRRSSRRGRVDGIIFFSMRVPDSFAKKWKDLEIPIVLVDTFHEAFDSITVENFQGAQIATEHLISLGHKNIGMITANIKSDPARIRLEGFRAAIQKHGLTPHPGNIIVSDVTKLDGFSRDAGYLAMKEMLKLGSNLPSAIFISSDVQAIGAISALREKGLRVPDDMAIVSFDDIELAQHFGLTTMRQPMFRMGELAVDQMVKRKQNPAALPVQMRFMPELVVRQSCGAKKLSPNIEDYVHHKDINELASPQD